MPLFDTLLQFANLFSAALVAGGQVAVLLVIVPVKRVWPGELSVKLHVAMLGHQIDRYLKPSGIVALLSAAGILIFVRGWPAVSIALTVVGIMGSLGVVITSRYFNVKTNAMMETWSLDAIPAEYPSIRHRWDLVHTIRTSCGVLAFSCHALAVILA